MSGLIKSFFIYFNIPMPIDLTFGSAFLLLLGVISDHFKYPLSISRRNDFFILSLLIFFCFAGFSLVYSSSSIYKFTKLIQLTTVIFASIIPLLIRKFNLLQFTRTYYITAILLAIIYVIVIQINGRGYGDYHSSLHGFSSSYLSISFSLGLGALLVFYGKTNIPKVERLIAFYSSFLLMFLLAARGPLIFFILSVLLIKLLPVFRSKLKLVANSIFIASSIILAGVLSFPFIYKKSELLQTTVFRMSLLISDFTRNSEINDSVNTRLNNITFTVESIFSSWGNLLFGSGIGSFGLLYSGEDGKLHPHNIILEVWFDLGLIGLILLGIAVAVPIIASSKNRLEKSIPAVVLIYVLLNYLKSGSYSEARLGFSALALYVSLQYLPEKLRSSKLI